MTRQDTCWYVHGCVSSSCVDRSTSITACVRSTFKICTCWRFHAHRKPEGSFSYHGTNSPRWPLMAPRCSLRPPKSFVNAVPGKPRWHSHSQPPLKIQWSGTLLPSVPVKKLRIGSWEELWELADSFNHCVICTPFLRKVFFRNWLRPLHREDSYKIHARDLFMKWSTFLYVKPKVVTPDLASFLSFLLFLTQRLKWRGPCLFLFVFSLFLSLSLCPSPRLKVILPF